MKKLNGTTVTLGAMENGGFLADVDEDLSQGLRKTKARAGPRQTAPRAIGPPMGRPAAYRATASHGFRKSTSNQAQANR